MQLRTINTILLLLIIVINLFILLTPFLPQVAYTLQGEAVEAELEERALTTHAPTDGEATSNSLIVPAMRLHESVAEVRSTQSISNSVWRRPNTSTPDRGGNTVIVGHRFTYTNPNGVFYHLDKVQVGDTVALTWDARRYIYKVREIRVVPASAGNVETQTDKPQLTLYSCTPLWNPKDRLVIIATLEKIL